jgi:hypothetical protein
VKPALSILIPALVERASKLPEELGRQISAQSAPVELLVLTDNRKRSIGSKRNALMDLAQGRFLTHLDDDDWIAPTYIEDIVHEIRASDVVTDYAKPDSLTNDTDVIVFNQEATWNGQNPFVVRCGVEFENEEVHKDPNNLAWQDIHRKPWHWNVWRTTLARCAQFADNCIDEDWFWLRQVIPEIRKQRRIDKVLHYYRYDSTVSASNQGKPACT